MIETFTRETFEPLLNTVFRVQRPDGDPLELELVEVVGGEQRGVQNSYSFSIIFRGAPSFLLHQRTHTLSHDSLGTFELFLVPIAREADGFRYEAVFNRLKK